MYTWPTTGDALVTGSQNPDAFGWDRNMGGPFQPLRPNGAFADLDTLAQRADSYYVRPALWVSSNGSMYDPMLGVSLQRTGAWPGEPYAPAGHLPIRAMSGRFATRLLPTTNITGCRPGRCSGCGATTAPTTIGRNIGDDFDGGALGCGFCIRACYIIMELTNEMCADITWADACEDAAIDDLYECIKDCYKKGACKLGPYMPRINAAAIPTASSTSTTFANFESILRAQ